MCGVSVGHAEHVWGVCEAFVGHVELVWRIWSVWDVSETECGSYVGRVWVFIMCGACGTFVGHLWSIYIIIFYGIYICKKNIIRKAIKNVKLCC